MFFLNAPIKVFHREGPREEILYLLLTRYIFGFIKLHFENAVGFLCLALLKLVLAIFDFFHQMIALKYL